MSRSDIPLAVAIGLSLCCSVGCSQTTEGEQSEATPGFVPCTDPRPEMCAQMYQPVCASVDTGVRCITTPCPSAESKPYPNACEACRDPAVQGYQEGECGPPE
jgi:hypothetical protein